MWVTTADDFALHTKANKAIIKEAKLGQIEYISLLTNTKHLQAAVRLYRDSGIKIPLGLHANLTEGRSILPASEVRSLVNGNENFYGLEIFLIRLWLGLIKEVEVEKEIYAQAAVMEKLRLKIIHINSHQNINLFPPLDKVFEKLAKKYNVKLLRQEESAIDRLKRFPLKMIMYMVVKWFFIKKYQRFSKPLNKNFKEHLIHPGTNYD